MTKIVLNPKGDGLTNGKEHTEPGGEVNVSPNLSRRLVDIGAAIYAVHYAAAMEAGEDPWADASEDDDADAQAAADQAAADKAAADKAAAEKG